MLYNFKQLIVNQYHASLRTVDLVIDKCPDASWDAPVHELAYCQAAFHGLFFADLYLDDNIESQKKQTFHVEHADVFRDYEELEPRRQQHHYERAWIKLYVQHCRDKAVSVMAAETAESLQAVPEIPWQKTSRAELHVNNIRHIQHHAAQLTLRLRLDHNIEMPWVASGWSK